MSRQRSLSWFAALRDLKADRASRPEVREERLRTTAGLRGSPALALSAWRGLSGRRYVVSVDDFDGFDLTEIGSAVLIAVARDATGIATVVQPVAGLTPREYPAWAALMADQGSTELHVHRLAQAPADRAALVLDVMTFVETEAA